MAVCHTSVAFYDLAGADMQGAVKTLAKAAVGALIKADPSELAVAGGAEAMGRLIDCLSGQPKTAYDRLQESVAREIERLPEHEFGGAKDKAAALGNAETLLEAHGLTASDLVALNLAPDRAAKALLERGAGMLTRAGEPVAGLVRDKIVPAVCRGLLQDPQHIETLKPAIFQALLAQREDIRALPGEVGRALRAWFGRHLVTDPTEAWRPDLTELSLLRAEYGVVPFHEQRRADLERLLAWCEAEATRGVRLVTGPGGTGKTRLMIELCDVARRRGWRAGFLHREVPPQPSWELDGLLDGERPLLLVVDYAETKREVLVPVLRTLAAGHARRRVILLAREVADWWRALQEADPKLQEMLADSLVPVERLAPIAEPLDQRRVVLEAAARAFAGKLGLEPPAIGRVELGAAHFADALFLHIAGLAAAVGDAATEEQALLDFVLKRERRHWRNGLESEKLAGDLDAASVAQTLALVTLAGGADDKAAARGLLEGASMLAGVTPARRDRLIGLLQRLYPGERCLEPIRPDLLGEHLVDEALKDDASLLDAALAAPAEAPLTVLTRLAKRRDGARRWLEQAFARDLERLAEPAMRVAIETGDPIGPVLARVFTERTERSAFLDYGLLARLDAAIPEQTTALLEVATAVTTQMRASLLQVPRPWRDDLRLEAARVATNLVRCLCILRRQKEALTAAEEARDHYRELAATRPDAFTPNLAGSLINLSNVLCNLGRHEGALVASEEACNQFRRFNEVRPNAFAPDLATALSSLANVLGNLDRREDAVAATGEACGLYRALATARPDVFNPKLAAALSNHANALSNFGQHEEARVAAEEAHDRFRALAATHPDAFTPDVAGCLVNLANTLSALGRREAALAAAKEARDLYCTLAAARPDAFNPDLARSLAVLANCMEATGQAGDALATNHEAIAALREPFLAMPAAFAHLMAPMCQQYVERCEKLGQEPDGGLLGPIAEACRSLVGEGGCDKAPQDG